MVTVSRTSGDNGDHKYETLGLFESEYDANICLAEAEERYNKFNIGLRVKINIYKSELEATIQATVFGRSVALESQEAWCPIFYTVDLDPGQLPGPPGAALQKVSRKVLRGSLSGTTSRVQLSRDLITPDDPAFGRPDEFIVFPACTSRGKCPKVIWLSHFEESDRDGGGQLKGGRFPEFYSSDTMQLGSAAAANRDAEEMFNAFLSGVQKRPDGAMLTEVASPFLWEGNFPENHRSRFCKQSWRFTQRFCREAPELCYAKAKHNGLFIGMFRDMVNDRESLHWVERHKARKASNKAKSIEQRRSVGRGRLSGTKAKLQTKAMKSKSVVSMKAASKRRAK